MKSLLGRIRRRFFGPVLHRLDVMDESVSARLEALEARLAVVESVIEMIDARASSVSERSVAQTESYVRLARRLDDIEKLLAEPPAGPDV